MDLLKIILELLSINCRNCTKNGLLMLVTPLITKLLGKILLKLIPNSPTTEKTFLLLMLPINTLLPSHSTYNEYLLLNKLSLIKVLICCIAFDLKINKEIMIFYLIKCWNILFSWKIIECSIKIKHF